MAEYKKGANDRNYGIFIVNDMAIALAHIVMVGKPYEAPVKRTKDDEEEAVKMWLINVYMTGVRDPLKIFMDKKEDAETCYLDIVASMDAFNQHEALYGKTGVEAINNMTSVIELCKDAIYSVGDCIVRRGGT